MKKEKYTLEYPLKNASETIIWKLIGTEIGLSEWFADDVKADGSHFIFTWDGYDEIATVKKIKENQLICFQWEDDDNTDAYFQLEITTNKLSGHITLIITDFAESNEIEDEKRLWNKHIESLFRLAGLSSI